MGGSQKQITIRNSYYSCEGDAARNHPDFGEKCRFLLPGTGEPRLKSLNPRASSFGLSRYIKQREQPEQSYRLQLEISPTRRNHHGQKTNLYTLVDPVSPPSEHFALQSVLVEAPGTAPGSDKLIALAVYHHSHSSCDV